MNAPFVEIENLPDGLLRFLLLSRWCKSERFSQMADEITAGQLPGDNQVAVIEYWGVRLQRIDDDAVG